MKSMKLASGFAISALALAVASNAAAETEYDVSFSGSLEVQSWFDFNNDDRNLPTNGFAGEDSGDMDGVEVDDGENNQGTLQAILDSTVSVTHGPFSGDLTIGGDIGGTSLAEGGFDQDNDGVSVGVENLKVEEGPISFGQLDSVVATDGLIDTVTDGGVDDLIGEDGRSFDDIRAAFRYTMDDLGLKLQLESEDDLNDFGAAVALNQDLDVAEVWFDAQFYEATIGGETEDRTFIGVGTELSPVDMVTLTAAFQQSNQYGEDADGSYGVKLDVDVTDTIMVFGQFYDASTETDDSEMIKVGYSAEFAPITVEGDYKASLEDVGEGTVFTKLTYAEGVITAWASHETTLVDGASNTIETRVEYSDSPWMAYAGSEFVLPDEGDTGVTITLGGNYTTESDIEYGAQYKNANEAAGDDHLARLYASYNF